MATLDPDVADFLDHPRLPKPPRTKLKRVREGQRRFRRALRGLAHRIIGHPSLKTYSAAPGVLKCSACGRRWRGTR